MWAPGPVRIWLFIGLILVFFQIVIGGVTRLTGSGLSITKWEIVTGTLPPVSDEEWEFEFGEYKQTPQFQKLNKYMSLSDFKFIYFWEYLHRLWARMMGLIFIFPFIYFLSKGMISRKLLFHLIVVIILAALAASFGWIMVASGLISRPWVDAYKLTIHLSLGLALISYLFWIWLESRHSPSVRQHFPLRNLPLVRILLVLVIIQILFGGMMSGLRAALLYPTFPTIGGEYFPDIVFNSEMWTVNNFTDYESSVFLPTLIHFIHRSLAICLFLYSLYISYKLVRFDSRTGIRFAVAMLIIMLIIQIILGILTLLHSIGEIPLWAGSWHQIVGIGILLNVVYINFKYSDKSSTLPVL